MSDEEVLTKAIRKAIDNCWDIPIHVSKTSEPMFKVLPKAFLVLFNTKGRNAVNYDLKKPGVGSFTTRREAIIYCHDFAKALWGTEDSELDLEKISPIGGFFDKDEQPPIPNYKVHLMMMVIADDPIDYLRQYLLQLDQTTNKET